ncbi:hypothetical protein ILUMI_17511 [Ignelater luminosus]|uniref:Uncharacterized protein n=1 Tax=Ignelater luminosus TaxID=2038154 RepID=A0A8K0CNX3_IGNLU|nr:hypothetical protein ILUMI_17511 [Ignelater luminosus]
MSTKFEHNMEHKIRWLLPEKTTSNQIDHMLINRKRMNMIKDVRSFRGANAESDHILVRAKTNIKKIDTKVKETKRTEELNVKETRKRYEEKVNRQLTNERETNNIEIKWNKIKQSLMDSAGKAIGRSNRERKKGVDR